MIEVERQTPNTLQADVLCLRVETLRNDFMRHPEPTQKTRDEAYLSITGVNAYGRQLAWYLLPQVVEDLVLRSGGADFVCSAG